MVVVKPGETEISTSERVLKGSEEWLITALEAKVLKKGMRFNLIPKDRTFNAVVEDQMAFGCGPVNQKKTTENIFMERIENKEKQKELQVPFLHMSNSIFITFLNRYKDGKKKLPEIFSFQLTKSKFVIRENDLLKAKELTMEFHFKF